MRVNALRDFGESQVGVCCASHTTKILLQTSETAIFFEFTRHSESVEKVLRGDSCLSLGAVSWLQLRVVHAASVRELKELTSFSDISAWRVL